MKRFAPWITLTVVVLFVVLVLAVRYLVVPANRPFECDNGVRIQLLSISHEEVDGVNHVSWSIEMRNQTDAPLDLSATATCRHGVPPRDVGDSGAPRGRVESIEVLELQATSWSDACPSPESGRWWYYTLRLEDNTGELRFRPITFAGKAH